MGSSKRVSVIARHLCTSASPSKCTAIEGADGLQLEPRIPVVVGAMVLDIHAKPGSGQLLPGTTTPGRVLYHRGGVGRNVAECMARLNSKPLLISVVGEDMAGDELVAHWRSLGLSVDGICRYAGASTPVVSAVFDRQGELQAAVADVQTVEKHLTPAWIRKFSGDIKSASIVMVDANLFPETLEVTCRMAYEANVPVWFEPVSVAKCTRAAKLLKYMTYVSPNEVELVAMAEALSSDAQKHPRDSVLSFHSRVESVMYELQHAIRAVLTEGVQYVVLTLGHHGAVLCTLRPLRSLPPGWRAGQVFLYHFPALPASVVSLSGAGDCLVAGALSVLTESPGHVLEAVSCGIAAAKAAVESDLNVPAQWSPSFKGEAESSYKSWRLLPTS